VLGTGGLATLGGCTGLLGGGDDETTPEGQYGIRVDNRFEARDFEMTDQITGPQPAVVDLRVGNLDPQSDETYFEERVEVATGDEQTVEAAFVVESGGPTYAVNATLEPFVEGGLAKKRLRSDGLTFAPGEYGEPEENPIPVVVSNANDTERLAPEVDIYQYREP
jgi:hypothetical protein